MPYYVFDVQRSVNGGAYEDLYIGTAARRFRETLDGFSDTDTITYRARARDLSLAADHPDNLAAEWSDPIAVPVSVPSPAPLTTLAAFPDLRGATSAELATYQSRHRVTQRRTLVMDGDGVWRDLGGLLGESWVLNSEIEVNLTAPVLMANFEFVTATETATGTVHSLAPLVQTSAVNVRTSNGTYDPLVQRGRRVQRWACGTPSGVTPSAGDWFLLFDGYFDDPKWNSKSVRVTARSLGCRLLDTQVRTTRTYGKPDSEGGESLSTVICQLLADNGLGDITLCVVGAINWQVRPVEIARGQTVRQALESLIQPTGYLLRDRPTNRTTLQLCLYAPVRTAVASETPSVVLQPERALSDHDFETISDGVRGGWEVYYHDAEAGEMRGPVIAKNDTTLFRYPGSWSGLVFDERSNIDTEAEAQQVADLALADTELPILRARPEFLPWPCLDLDDVVGLAPEFVKADTQQVLAVAGWIYRDSNTTQNTTVTLEGRHRGAYGAWLRGISMTAAARGPLAITATATHPLPGSDDTRYVVSVGARVTRSGMATGQVADVALTELFGGVTILDGPALGQRAPAGQVWILSRPAAGGTEAPSFAFRAEIPATPALYDEDRDPVPAQGADLTGVARLAWDGFGVVEALSDDLSTYYEGTLSDPSGSATGDATVELKRTGPGDAPVPATPLTGPLPLTVGFSAARQPFQSGESMVEVYGSAPGVQGEWQRVTVQAVERDTATLAPELTLVWKSATQFAFIGTCPDPLGAGVTLILEAAGGAIIALGDGSVANPWVVDRPAFGSGAGRVTLVATGAGYVTGTDAADVQPRERDTISLTIETAPFPVESPAYFDLQFICADPLQAGLPVFAVSGTAAASVFNSYALNAYTAVYDVRFTRPAVGSGAAMAEITATLAGREAGRKLVEVPEVSRDTITLPKPTVETSNHTATGFRATISLSDPLGVVPPDPFVIYAAEGSASYVAGPGGGTSGATRTAVLDITRGAHGTSMGFVRLVASVGGAVSAPLEIPVPPQEDTATAGKTLTIRAMGFNAMIDTMTWQFPSSGTYVWNPSTTTGSTLLYPVALPPDAVVTGITVHYRATAASDVQMTLRNAAGSLYESLGSNTGGVDGSASGVLSHTVSASDPLFLRVILAPNLGGAAYFVKAVITYTAPSLTVSV